MFQFPGFASDLCRYHVFNMVGCPIRKSADQRPFAPSRGLSQLVTSFIACESLGIRHVPFFYFRHNGTITFIRPFGPTKGWRWLILLFVFTLARVQYVKYRV